MWGHVIHTGGRDHLDPHRLGGSSLARSEPFRALLEEAFSDEGVPLPASLDKPKTLERRLDQVSLATHHATPERGTAISPLLRLESGLSAPPPPPVDVKEVSAPIEVSPAARDLLDELDTTAKLTRPAAVDAALQDALAEPPVTMPLPSIFRQPTLNVPAQSLVPARSDDVSEPVPAAPKKELPRPPPLPAKAKPKLIEAKPTLVPKPVVSPKPVIVASSLDAPRPLEVKPVETMAPVPKIVQVLEDVTIPGIQRPGSTSNSNNSGRMISATDLYRLQLEFEDTPARPRDRVAAAAHAAAWRGDVGEAEAAERDRRHR
jgi:hypothetical protein